MGLLNGFREGGQLRRIEISFFTKASRKGGFNFSSKREGKFISRDGKDRTSVQLQAFQPLKRSEWTVNQREETRPFPELVKSIQDWYRLLRILY